MVGRDIRRRARRWDWSTGCFRTTRRASSRRRTSTLKDRIKEFDEYYPCTKDECDLSHVRNWLNLFVDMHYARRRHMRFGELVRFLGGDTP
jgi:hypothetical protein